MARKRAANYDGVREAILAHAAALFAEQGYAATSMNQVAQACGLSKASLYHYVRDKDALLVAIAETHVMQLHALVDDTMARPRLSAEARLRLLITRFVEAYADAQHAHRVLTEDTRFMAVHDRERVLTHERAVVSAFAKAVSAVRPETEPSALSKPLTMLLFGMINWMFTWLRREGTLTHESMAPIVADLFLQGLPGVRVGPMRTVKASVTRSPRRSTLRSSTRTVKDSSKTSP